MRTTLLCMALCAGLSVGSAADAQTAPVATACESTANGDLRVHRLASRIFGNERNIRVLLPVVDGRYRTLTGRPNTGIGGSSYGGVASLYALLAKPNTFGYGLIESPVLAIGMGQLVRDTSPLIAMPEKVFMAFGGKEAGDPAVSERLIDLVRRVETNFRAAGYDETNFRVVVEPEAMHTEAAWEKRLPGALAFLFGEWKPEPAR